MSYLLPTDQKATDVEVLREVILAGPAPDIGTVAGVFDWNDLMDVQAAADDDCADCD